MGTNSCILIGNVQIAWEAWSPLDFVAHITLEWTRKACICIDQLIGTLDMVVGLSISRRPTWTDVLSHSVQQLTAVGSIMIELLLKLMSTFPTIMSSQNAGAKRCRELHEHNDHVKIMSQIERMHYIYKININSTVWRLNYSLDSIHQEQSCHDARCIWSCQLTNMARRLCMKVHSKFRTQESCQDLPRAMRKIVTIDPCNKTQALHISRHSAAGFYETASLENLLPCHTKLRHKLAHDTFFSPMVYDPEMLNFSTSSISRMMMCHWWYSQDLQRTWTEAGKIMYEVRFSQDEDIGSA